MGSPILEVEDVTFGYTSDRPVLQDTSFRIDEPEFLCIVGPNGVGKSTLVRCVNGSIKPSSGTVRVHGRDVSEYPLKELALHVSYVPVATEDYSIMSVLDTVLVGRYAHQKWNPLPRVWRRHTRHCVPCRCRTSLCASSMNSPPDSTRRSLWPEVWCRRRTS